ncbi:MAG TPA: RtcB family protein [bacterium]|nr:RtcB family protein [bacterium]
MRVPGLVYASPVLLPKILADRSVEQVANVACLPGILRYSLAMPDIHWGYGAPIGGVAAFDLREGVAVPGITGYDINCGVRLLGAKLPAEAVTGRVQEVVEALYRAVPCGVGKAGRFRLKKGQMARVLAEGAAWAVREGYGSTADLEHMEDGGCLEGADPEQVSPRALERGSSQLATLGSGNHFLELQQVEQVFEPAAADAFGLFPGQLTVMIHTGSRGLGYQVADDYLASFGRAASRYGIRLPDRQLACAPVESPEGRDYLGAMAAAANFAFANRQLIAHDAGQALARSLERSDLELVTVYDIAHNIARFESHRVEGREVRVLVHRKGATRAFPAGRSEVPADYRAVGQPVLIPGTMGTASYVLVGTSAALEEAWGSSCHGAGRSLSRSSAVRSMKGRSAVEELAARGVAVRAPSLRGLAEEMPEAYKDVEQVIEAVEGGGLARRVARLVPFAVIKG